MVSDTVRCVSLYYFFRFVGTQSEMTLIFYVGAQYKWYPVFAYNKRYVGLGDEGEVGWKCKALRQLPNSVFSKKQTSWLYLKIDCSLFWIGFWVVINIEVLFNLPNLSPDILINRVKFQTQNLTEFEVKDL